MKKIAALVVLMLCSCTMSEVSTTAPVITWIEHPSELEANNNEPISINIEPSWNYPRHTFSDIPINRERDVLKTCFIQSLSRISVFEVYDVNETTNNGSFANSAQQYTLKFELIANEDNIDATSEEFKDLFYNVGYVVNTVAPFVATAASAGGVLIGFKYLTGIPTGKSDEQEIGVVIVQFSLWDNKEAKLIDSQILGANFGHTYALVGDVATSITSGNAKYHSSTKDEALNAITLAASEQIFNLIVSHQSEQNKDV